MRMNRKLSSKKMLAFLISLTVVIALALCWIWVKYGYRSAPYECTNFAMGSYVQQTVYGKNAEKAASEAAAQIGVLENLISWRLEGSDIQKLNAEAGVDWLEFHPKTIGLLNQSLDVAAKSEGAFDPTILPVSALWDFGGENQHVPENEQIKNFLPYVNYKNLRVNAKENTASLKYHYTAVDLGAIGKGAACDEAVSAYRSADAEYGIVAVGGSVGVYGHKPNGSLWSIAVRDPTSGGDKTVAMGTIDLSSGFISTSGSYEKQFEQDGTIYHHLLNPKTGYPENNELVSVTVTAENGALSDALATACFIMGTEKGIALLNEYDAGGVFIGRDDSVLVTDGLKGQFHLASSRYHLVGGAS